MDCPSPVRVALLGAGIFATDAYAPVLRDIKDVLLPRYVWSRSQEAAEKLAVTLREWAGDVEAVWGEEGLCTVEIASDVPCCAVVLPIQNQLGMVRRMLSAGKHVLQEKPLAATLEEAREMMQWYSHKLAPLPPSSKKPFWGVAENFRCEPVFAKAAELVQSLGCLLSASMCIEVAMAPTNKYYTSQWRRDPSLEGAFITDCGVHYVAALREMISRNIEWVSAHATHMDPSLPSPDNLTASFLLEGEEVRQRCSGTLQINFYAPFNKMLWRAVCKEGVVEVTRGSQDGKFGYKVSLIKAPGAPEVTFFEFKGIELELRAFAREVALRTQHAGRVDDEELKLRPFIQGTMIAPSQAWDDLVVVAACLDSSAKDGDKVHASRKMAHSVPE